ncbi:MAG: hypothetical protein AB7V77_01670 [Candidatus Woesearchaeota archaeon]
MKKTDLIDVVNDIELFLKRAPNFIRYKNMFLDLHNIINFNLFFSKLKKTYFKNKTDESILNELKSAYDLKNICGFSVFFMPDKDLNEKNTTKKGTYMIFNMPENVQTKDLIKIKKPDILALFKGKPIYVEIKTIHNSIKKLESILAKINEASEQIKPFGKGFIHLFFQTPSDYLISNLDELKEKILVNMIEQNYLGGVMITFYDLEIDEQISTKHRRRVYKQKTNCIMNTNFKNE